MADIRDPIAWCEEMMGGQFKVAELYHGSPYEVARLEPKHMHGGPDAPAAVFASPFRSFALAYTGGKWGDRDLNQGLLGAPGEEKIHLHEMRPGAFEDTFKGKKGHMYVLPSEGFESPEESKSIFEVMAKKPITPSEIEAVEDVLKELEAAPDVVMHPYDASSKDTKDIIKRRVKRGLGEEYKNWYLENATDEIKSLWEEAEKEASFGIRMSKEASMKKKAQPKGGVGGVQQVQGVQQVAGVGQEEPEAKVTSAQKKQELDAWGRWIQDKNPQDFKFLLESYTPFMNYMGQRHLQAAKTGGTLPQSTIKADMIQNFHRGLETFDPNKGQMNTHIGNHLRHTGRFVRTYSNIGKMPDPRSRMVWQYKDRETVLTERLGRQPSSAEMADDLGMSQKDVELLRTEIRKDIIVDPTTSGLGSIAPESPKAMEQLNFLHMELAPDQQNILEYTYGMHGRQAVDNNEELAQILGISPQKVRAIKRQIARRYEKRYR